MSDDLLNVDEAAAMLGVPRRRMHALLCEGTIPHIKIGKRTLRVPAVELERWVVANTMNAVPTDRPIAGFIPQREGR